MSLSVISVLESIAELGGDRAAYLECEEERARMVFFESLGEA